MIVSFYLRPPLSKMSSFMVDLYVRSLKESVMAELMTVRVNSLAYLLVSYKLPLVSWIVP